MWAYVQMSLLTDAAQNYQFESKPVGHFHLLLSQILLSAVMANKMNIRDISAYFDPRSVNGYR